MICRTAAHHTQLSQVGPFASFHNETAIREGLLSTGQESPQGQKHCRCMSWLWGGLGNQSREMARLCFTDLIQRARRQRIPATRALLTQPSRLSSSAAVQHVLVGLGIRDHARALGRRSPSEMPSQRRTAALGSPCNFSVSSLVSHSRSEKEHPPLCPRTPSLSCGYSGGTCRSLRLLHASSSSA